MLFLQVKKLQLAHLYLAKVAALSHLRTPRVARRVTARRALLLTQLRNRNLRVLMITPLQVLTTALSTAQRTVHLATTVQSTVHPAVTIALSTTVPHHLQAITAHTIQAHQAITLTTQALQAHIIALLIALHMILPEVTRAIPALIVQATIVQVLTVQALIAQVIIAQAHTAHLITAQAHTAPVTTTHQALTAQVIIAKAHTAQATTALAPTAQATTAQAPTAQATTALAPIAANHPQMISPRSLRRKIPRRMMMIQIRRARRSE
jgi:hypothetical protein